MTELRQRILGNFDLFLKSFWYLDNARFCSINILQAKWVILGLILSFVTCITSNFPILATFWIWITLKWKQPVAYLNIGYLKYDHERHMISTKTNISHSKYYVAHFI